MREGSYEAHCLDEAVATFGNALSAELADVEGKDRREIERKQEAILLRWLGDEEGPAPGQFRDPADELRR